MFDTFKEKAVEKTANKYFGQYGKIVLDGSDFSKCRINGFLELEGEDEMVSFLLEYSVESSNGVSAVIIKKLSLSKKWMQLMATDFVKGRRFEVGGTYAYLLKLL